MTSATNSACPRCLWPTVRIPGLRNVNDGLGDDLFRNAEQVPGGARQTRCDFSVVSERSTTRVRRAITRLGEKKMLKPTVLSNLTDCPFSTRHSGGGGRVRRWEYRKCLHCRCRVRFNVGREDERTCLTRLGRFVPRREHRDTRRTCSLCVGALRVLETAMRTSRRKIYRTIFTGDRGRPGKFEKSAKISKSQSC